MRNTVLPANKDEAS